MLIEQDEDGVFLAAVPSLPGSISQGRTRDEALSNAREAIAGYLESLEAHPPPSVLKLHRKETTQDLQLDSKSCSNSLWRITGSRQQLTLAALSVSWLIAFDP